MCNLSIVHSEVFHYLCTRFIGETKCLHSPDGGIGRRVGLKHQWGNTRAGSIPAPGTLFPKMNNSEESPGNAPGFFLFYRTIRKNRDYSNKHAAYCGVTITFVFGENAKPLP